MIIDIFPDSDAADDLLQISGKAVVAICGVFRAEDGGIDVAGLHFGQRQENRGILGVAGVMNACKSLTVLAVTPKRQFAVMLAEAAEKSAFFVDQGITRSVFCILSGFIFGNCPRCRRTSCIHGTLMSFVFDYAGMCHIVLCSRNKYQPGW